MVSATIGCKRLCVHPPRTSGKGRLRGKGAAMPWPPKVLPATCWLLEWLLAFPGDSVPGLPTSGDSRRRPSSWSDWRWLETQLEQALRARGAGLMLWTQRDSGPQRGRGWPRRINLRSLPSLDYGRLGGTAGFLSAERQGWFISQAIPCTRFSVPKPTCLSASNHPEKLVCFRPECRWRN